MWSTTPRPWHHALDTIPLALGIAIFKQNPLASWTSWDVVFIGGSLIAIGVGSWWSTDMGMVADKRNDRTNPAGVKSESELREEARRLQDERNAPKAPDGFIPTQAALKRLVTGKQVFNQVVVQPQVVQKDPRWQQWAQSVLYSKVSMSQSKWTGRGKMFSKTEYTPRINAWLKDGYIATVNPRDANQGYKIAGSRGRDFFQGIATGREFIPLPQQTKVNR